MPDPARHSYAFFGKLRWDGRWGSGHHLASRIAESRRVVWLEMPVRPLKSLGVPRTRTVGRGVMSIVPVDYPLQRFPTIERACVRSAAGRVRHGVGSDHPVAAVVYPRAPLEVVRALRPDRIVYHALDDYSELEDGTPDDRFNAWEREAIDLADLVIAISEPLRERLSKLHPTVVFHPLGYDEDLFPGPAGPPPPELATLPRPILGFAGTLRPGRLDLPLLLEAAHRRPDSSFVFLGDRQGEGDIGEIEALPNVHVLPFRPKEEVPRFVAAFDAALCTYRNSRLNRGCYPLKVVEALAAGVPAVFTPPRPDLEHFAPNVRFGGDVDEVLEAVDEVLAQGRTAERIAERRAAVADLGWGRLANRFRSTVE